MRYQARSGSLGAPYAVRTRRFDAKFIRPGGNARIGSRPRRSRVYPFRVYAGELVAELDALRSRQARRGELKFKTAGSRAQTLQCRFVQGFPIQKRFLQQYTWRFRFAQILRMKMQRAT